MEAVLSGKDLEVRLFQFQVFQDCVRTLRVDGFAQICAWLILSVFANDSFAGIVFSYAKIYGDSCLLNEEADDGHVEVEQSFRLTVKYGKDFVLIVIEIRGCALCGYDGPLMLQEPWFGPVYLDFRYRLFVCAAFMDDRHLKLLYSVCTVEIASVTVRLFLEILAGFYIYGCRFQLRRFSLPA